MTDLIKWCNDNQGFLSALLAMLSVILSVIAIHVSITVAKLPFKKKISIGFYANILIGAEGSFYSVSATNIGNRPIMITYVGLGFLKKGKLQKVILTKRSMAEKKILNVNEVLEERYTEGELEEIRKNGRLYAMAFDVEGKVYKRKLKY